MQWIKCSERLPAMFVSVLVCIPSQKPFPAIREGYLVSRDSWWNVPALRQKFSIAEVTHWAKMPEPPDEEEDEHDTK